MQSFRNRHSHKSALAAAHTVQTTIELVTKLFTPAKERAWRRTEFSKNRMCIPFSRAYTLIYVKNTRKVLVSPFSKLSKRSTGTCSSILVSSARMNSEGIAGIHGSNLNNFQINAYITVNTHMYIGYVVHVCDHSKTSEMTGRRAFRLVCAATLK